MNQERLHREIDLLSRSYALSGINPTDTIIQLVREHNRPNGPEPPLPPTVEFQWPANGYAIPGGGRFRGDCAFVE
jgi:hypothetical protein